MAVKNKAWTRVKDLPPNLSVKKTPSGQFWGFYVNGNNIVHQESTRNEVLLWLDENPAVTRTAREFYRMGDV